MLSTTTFMSLPVELRGIVYQHVLDDPVKGEVVGSKWPTSERPFTALNRQRAYLSSPAAAEDSGRDTDRWTCPETSLALVSRQVRHELLDLVRRGVAPVDVVVRVTNFDFGPAIRFLEPVRTGKQAAVAFGVPSDGVPLRWLRLEFEGPYGPGWQANLGRWIDYVQSTMKHPEELATLHRTIAEQQWRGNKERARSNSWVHLDLELAMDMYDIYARCERGPHRIECYKVLMMVVGRLSLRMPGLKLETIRMIRAKGRVWKDWWGNSWYSFD